MRKTKAQRPGWQSWLPWLGALLGLVALLWVLRGLDLQRFRVVLAQSDLRFLVALPVVIIVEQVIRAWKWRQLLWPLRAISTVYLFGAIMAGYLLASLIPFGFGTIARSWLVARREDLKLTSVLATVALDRMTDGLVFVFLVPVAVLATVFPDPTGGIRAGLAWGAGGSLVLVVLLFAGFELFRRQAVNPGPLIRRVEERLPARLVGPTRRLTVSFAGGINWPQEPSRVTGIVLASIGVKLFAALQIVPAGLAFGVTLRPAEYLFVMVFLGFLVILGHFLRLAGGFILAAVFALRLFGVPEEEALAMALVIQVVNILSIAAVGAAALWAQGIVLSEFRAASINSDNIAPDRQVRNL